MDSKICKICKVNKLISEFSRNGYTNGKQYYRACCKSCQYENSKDYRKKYYSKNKDRVLARQRDYYNKPEIRKQRIDYSTEYRKKNPDCRKRQYANKLARMFNFNSTDDFNGYIDSLWKKQKGRCRICGIKLVRHGKNGNGMAIDHDHSDMVIRGLLCRNHNFAIGLLQDSVELCSAAAEYLRNSKADK